MFNFKKSAIKQATTVALLTAGAMLTIAEPVMAKNIGEIAGAMTGQAAGLSKMAGALSAAAGFFMALIGALKFKAHKDNPQQTALSVPIVYIFVAALLLYLPTVISTGGDTLFGGKQASQGIDGAGIAEGL